ncbi:splicing factor, Prp19-binding domain-containing protein [Annulohypoxylon bovei var. microspora]|nr:splicing factor, Prp19-binding domain-containing protein [Annulohypoxylon bovei var. microspora]
MPPAMKSKKMTANPARPTRYRAGKPTGVSSSESESDASESEAEQQQQTKRKIAPPPKAPSAGKIISNLSKVNLDDRRKQDQEAETRRVEAAKAARLAAEEGFVTEESEDEEESEEGSGEEDSEEEESSEEETPRRLMLKPKFVPKNQRNKTSTQEQDEEANLAEEEAKKKQAMDDMVEEQMRKAAAARATRKGHWNDNVDEEEDVDTEDDIEPEAEYAAWKVRELKRIKRDREAIEASEKMREEVERRRNLTEEERKAEDDEFIAKQKDEKDSKGKMSFMQKYFHKGAFYRDEAEAEGLANRDIMGTRITDDVKNRDLLPKALQMRDMTKLGKKGASKYRDLKSEDTGQWGSFRDTRPGKEFDRYNVDDRFKPDNFRDRSGPGGANAIPLGERKKPVPGAPEGPRGSERGRDLDRDSYRPRDDYEHRDRDRPDRDGHGGRRKRDSSRGTDRYESDKRRKTDTT